MRPRRTRFVLGMAAVVAVGAMLAGCATSPVAHRLPRAPMLETRSDAITNARGLQLGMYYGDQSLAATDAALGTTPAIHLTYHDWKSDWSHDPVLAADAGRGQTSLVNWEPFGADFHDIVRGRYDALITKQAKGAATLRRPVMLDFAAEMNEEEGWGGHDPALYVAAWRHVHDLFAAEAGGAVQWVWAPNNTDSDGAPAAIEYYPGSAYVDWTGIDGYNWGTSDPDFDWQSFASVFGDMYGVLHRLGKPIIIGETASAEQGGSKAGWIASILPTLAKQFPDVKALVWFDIQKERDWRIHSSSSAFSAVKKLANDRSVVSAAPVRAAATRKAVDGFDVEGFEPEGADAALIDQNAAAVNVIGVDGLLLRTDGTGVSAPSTDAKVRRDRAHADGLTAQLLVSNYDEGIGDFSEPIAKKLLTSATNRAKVVNALAADVRTGGWDSIMIDFEAMSSAEKTGLTSFAKELRAKVGDSVRLDIAIAASTTKAGYAAQGWDVAALAAPLDHLTLMAYDQHGPWEPNDPGPVGALDWTTQSVAALKSLAPADQIVLGVAGYGYHWHGPDAAAQVSDREARDRVAAAHATATWNGTVGEWTATLPNGEVLWWSDARSLGVRETLAEQLGLTGVAVWSLDLSDTIVPVR
ncbi:glycosyl hydrolase family 18 protein [Curtobacterium sp. RRHDQ10]|uniref:glycosyl hydrolase family 18 protein n=1 Tax=Curtobacterium phyllosphaerae TaxID=3413379 RepID=UPI003BF26D2D